MTTVSHELRTPIAAIKGSIEILLGACVGSENSTQRKMIEITLRNSNRLVMLVDNLLDVSAIRSGLIQLRKDRRDLVETLRGAVEERLLTAIRMLTSEGLPPSATCS